MNDDLGLGSEAHALVGELYPICRSITGDGVRETLRILGRHVPVHVTEVPSGTEVLDWTVPPEWNVRDAWIADADGRRVVDFRVSNLHLVNYSEPVRTRMTLDELRPRLHALPDRPDAVPYRTAYYERTWGFCLSQRALDAVAPGSYDVCVDTTLEPGSLTYGEVVIPGLTDDEILVSAHLCHPSLADDNLSGLSVAALLARELLAGPTPRHTIRFVFAPGTIGAITWLAQHRDHVAHIRHGLTLTCLGDGHPFTWKRTFGGSAAIDRAAAHVLATTDLPSQQIDWFPYGYDERQYGSPGFRLPVGSLMRGRHGQFPEYHTSMDDVAFVTAEHLGESIGVLRRLLRVVDQDRAVRSTQPYGEPQLGRRGLYRALGGTSVASSDLVMLWILALADGEHTLLDVAERASTTFESVLEITALLAGSGLVVDA